MKEEKSLENRVALLEEKVIEQERPKNEIWTYMIGCTFTLLITGAVMMGVARYYEQHKQPREQKTTQTSDSYSRETSYHQR